MQKFQGATKLWCKRERDDKETEIATLDLNKERKAAQVPFIQ
jgi:hypothetical protein